MTVTGKRGCLTYITILLVTLNSKNSDGQIIIQLIELFGFWSIKAKIHYINAFFKMNDCHDQAMLHSNTCIKYFDRMQHK